MAKSKLLTVLIVVALAVLAYVNYAQRVKLAMELKKLTVQLETGDNAENAAQAQAIIAKVRRHIDLPTDPEPTVATIVDVETLRQRNAFYNNAKNGDHLIVTPTRAVLFDPDQDKIIDVIPVQLQAEPEAPSA